MSGGFNFTEEVRQVLQAAREEAMRLGHDYVGTEHMLLGLLRAPGSSAIRLLEHFQIDPASLRATLEAMVPPGSDTVVGPDLPYTSRAKKVLELSMVSARAPNHDVVRTGHLVLGLLAEGNGPGGQVLIGAGMDADAARHAVRALYAGEDVGVREPTPPAAPAAITIITRHANGQVGARNFPAVGEAIAYLQQWLPGPS